MAVKKSAVKGTINEELMSYLLGVSQTQEMKSRICNIIMNDITSRGQEWGNAEWIDIDDFPESKYDLGGLIDFACKDTYVACGIKTEGDMLDHWFIVNTDEISIFENYNGNENCEMNLTNLMEMDLRMITERVIRDMSRLFLADHWEPDRFRNCKITVGFVDLALYNEFLRYIKDAKMNNSFSAIYVNAFDYEVAKEETLHRRNSASKKFCIK